MSGLSSPSGRIKKKSPSKTREQRKKSRCAISVFLSLFSERAPRKTKDIFIKNASSIKLNPFPKTLSRQCKINSTFNHMKNGLKLFQNKIIGPGNVSTYYGIGEIKKPSLLATESALIVRWTFFLSYLFSALPLMGNSVENQLTANY